MELTFTPNDRGQVGIGTLIVFIAMVLVAAIAAGVLINTAGFLQTQAEDTGTESTEQVANNLNVINEIGIVNDTGSGEGQVNQLEIGIQPAAGSDDLNLEELSLQYVADESFSNLVHAKAASAGNENELIGEGTVFNTVPVTAEDGEDNVMTDNADRYDLVVPLDDDVPFVEATGVEVEGQEEFRTTKLDIVFDTNEGDETDVVDNLNGVTEKELDVDDFVEVAVGADTFEDASIFGETDGDGNIDDPGDFVANAPANDGSIVDSNGDLDVAEGDLARITLFDDTLDALQLNGFDDETEELEHAGVLNGADLTEDGAIAEAFFADFSNDNLDELVEGEEVEVTYTTETGAQTVSILQVPDSLAGEDDDDAVDL